MEAVVFLIGLQSLLNGLANQLYNIVRNIIILVIKNGCPIEPGKLLADWIYIIQSYEYYRWRKYKYLNMRHQYMVILKGNFSSVFAPIWDYQRMEKDEIHLSKEANSFRKKSFFCCMHMYWSPIDCLALLGNTMNKTYSKAQIFMVYYKRCIWNTICEVWYAQFKWHTSLTSISVISNKF